MRINFWCVLICTFVGKYPEASKISMDKLGFRNNYNGIVRDLIKNWESPIVYLRQLGYLPSDYEDTSKIKPNLDALMSRIERDDQQQALQTEDVKSKEHFSGTVDTQQKQKRENFVLQLKNKRKVNTERRQREVTGSQNVNYPTMVQLLAMWQHSKSLANVEPKANELQLQQKPVEQKLMLLSRLLSRQRQEQVRPQIDASVDLLQRLVDKTSPSIDGSMAQQTKPQVAVVSISKNNDNLFLSRAEAGGNPPIGPPAMQELLDNNAGNSASAIFPSNSGSGLTSSMSMYGNLLKSIPKFAIHSSQFSRPDEAQSKVDNQPQIEAPQYLNWDIMNNRLKKVSTIAKNAYVDKLVHIFVKRQEALDIQKAQT